MIKLIREHLSTKIFIITVCLLITVGSAIYGMVAWGVIAAAYLQFLNYNLWALFFIGIPLEAMVVISTLFRKKNVKKRDKNKGES